MTESNRQFNSVAPLRNVVAMVQLVDRVISRAPTLPGMAVFYGPSGYGKSSAATYAMNTFAEPSGSSALIAAKIAPRSLIGILFARRAGCGLSICIVTSDCCG